MKAILILGSRNLKGQTAQVAHSFLKGWEGPSNLSETILLPERRIARCRQCDDQGWGQCRTEGACVIEDDFTSIVSEMKNAHLAIFATPVYFGALSESLRAFLDRLRRISMAEAGREGIEGKAAVGICVAGGGGGGASSCCLDLERVLQTSGFDVRDMLPCRRQNLDLKATVAHAMGAWLAEHIEAASS